MWNPDALTQADQPGLKGVTPKSHISTPEPALKASVSPKEVMEQVPFGPQESIKPFLFHSPETGVEQSSFIPADPWDMSFNRHGAIYPTPFDSPETAQLSSFEFPDFTEQASFSHQEVPIIFPPAGCVPTKTGWTPRSFEDAALFQDAINQSPQSDFDFSNFVAV